MRRLIVVALAATLVMAYARAVAAVEVPPEITSPTQGADLSDVVTVTATSDAPYVAARWGTTAVVDGVVPVAGTATLSLPSFGIQGDITITVAECTETPPDPEVPDPFRIDCLNAATAGTSDSVTVSVTNDDALFTDPVAPSVYWDNTTTITIEADAPGGGVRFGGYEYRYDNHAPYTIRLDNADLAEGKTIQFFLKLCSDPTWEGPVCEATPTDTLQITVKRLSPTIVDISPPAISPNGDGYRDRITVTYDLDEPQDVSYWIDGPGGDTEPLALGTLDAGTHTFRWPPDGNEEEASTGGYNVRLRTAIENSPGIPINGASGERFDVDLTEPNVTDPKASLPAVYPARDGYRDAVTLSAVVNEPMDGGSIEVFNDADKVVRTVRLKGTDRDRIVGTWDGRNDEGKPVPPGPYRFRITAYDEQHLSDTSVLARIKVSDEKLVRKTFSVVKDGDRFGSIWYWGPDRCQTWSVPDSDYPDGLLLTVTCRQSDEGANGIEARFAFDVPAAMDYRKVTLSTYGAADPAKVWVGGGFKTDSGDFSYASPHRLDGESTAWRTLMSTTDAGAVNVVRDRRVLASVWVPGVWARQGYDIGKVKITVAYAVLQ